MRSSDPIIGRKLGDYAIVDVLGHGGMARVYRGYDAKLDRYAAVKVIDSTMMIGQDPEEYRSRFQKEGRAIAHLRHPNIVTVYQFDQVGTLYYMAMSFIEGKDLRHVLKSFSRGKTFMPYGQVLRIIYDMASALDYAHSAGVIHRDIKPSNIMVTPDGHAVLTDFGLALNRSEGTIGNTFGSAYYIAPEQAVSSAQSVPQSDLYSLGVVLYEMLAGRMPFDDPAPMQVALQHLNNAPPPPSTFNPLITREIDRMVLKTLDKKPERRYPTGAAMTKALKEALGVVNDDDTFKLNIMQLPNWGEERRSTSSTPLTDISNSSRREVSSTRRQMMNRDKGEMTPQFASYTDDAPTVTQSKISARLRGEIFPQPRRRRPIGIYLAILLFALAGVIVAAGVVLLPRLMSPTVTSPATIAATNTAAVVAVIPTSFTPTETVLPTFTPTTIPATPEPVTATTIPASIVAVVPTLAATSADTPAPTASPTVIATVSEATVPPTREPIASVSLSAPVVLRYDSTSLTLWNRSSAEVNVSRLTFIQIKPDGSEVTFESRLWDEGSRPTSQLAPGGCFQVWTTDFALLDQPDYCDSRQGWAQTSFIHWFWVSTDPDATFEVRRGDTLLATCRIGAGECSLTP